MTFEEYITKHLTDRGFFDNDAQEVVSMVKSAKENEAMKQRWNDHIEGYPPQMIRIAEFTTNNHAIQWIEKNKPLSWFKELFKN